MFEKADAHHVEDSKDDDLEDTAEVHDDFVGMANGKNYFFSGWPIPYIGSVLFKDTAEVHDDFDGMANGKNYFFLGWPIPYIGLVLFKDTAEVHDDFVGMEGFLAWLCL